MTFFIKTLVLFTFSFSVAMAQDPALRAGALKLWEKRDNQESLSGALTKFEQLHSAAPKDTEYLIYLVRAHFLLGDSFAKDKDDSLKHFEKAMKYGEDALETNPEYVSRQKKNDEVKHVVAALGIKEVPQIYWTAVSIGKYAKTKGIMASLSYKSKILALISRVEELNPDFFYGAVDRYWGVYFAVIPSIIGKDLKKSKKHFEKSLVKGPEYLGTKVLEAEIYYVEKDDKKSFKEVLTEVLADSTHDHHPELGPENRLEKLKAKKLLDKMDDFF